MIHPLKYAFLLSFLFYMPFIQAQDSLGNKVSQRIPLVCSFSCNNSYAFLQFHCPSGSTVLREVPIESTHVNPYVEFDAVIGQLKKDSANPYTLSYLFRACSAVCNAASTLDLQNLQMIYYNQDFMDGLRGSNDSIKWAIRCIVAHEIGHHFLGHTLPSDEPIEQGERRKRERRADYFCGFVIRQFPDATLQDALRGLNSLNTVTYLPQTDEQENGSDYPTLKHREEAVTDGFMQATNDSLRLSLFKNIDSVALVLYQKYQHSQIFRFVDKEMANKNLNEAKGMIDQFLRTHPDFEGKDVLLKQKSLIYELMTNRKEAIKSQRDAVKLAPENPEQLNRLKELLEKGNINDKKEAEKIKEKLKVLKGNQN